jgi:uncharacterized protein DUF2846
MKITRLGAVLTAVAVAVLSGCATNLPSTEEMKADTAAFQLPKLPEANKAMVYVVRPAFVGTAVRFNVFVDDQESKSEMGYTRGKQYIYFHVAPGEHKIFSKAENWAEVSLSAKAGDVFFIQQEPSMGIIMARNSLFKLEDYQGKYHVKRLSLGTIIKTDK